MSNPVSGRSGASLLLAIALVPLLAASTGDRPPSSSDAEARVPIRALCIPLADHYAALVAYERYAPQMIHAEFQIEQMPNWDLLRAKFRSGQAEMAFVMSPLAMDMFRERPFFRWVVLYRYLKEHGATFTLTANTSANARIASVPPAQSPAFIRGASNRGKPAAFEQSLPWADVVETGGFGHIAWYSKDVMPWPGGHVECLALATDTALGEKSVALAEVMAAIQRAARDIEDARVAGGPALEAIADIIRKHIPGHNREAILASLDLELDVINYRDLNVDKRGLQQIMEWAIEGGILSGGIDVEHFADTRFDTER